MLAQMRQNTKTIMWVVIVGFVGLIFTVWGMNLRSRGGMEAGFVGRIGKDRIALDEYRGEVQNQRASYYESEDRRPTVQAEKMIADNAWEAIVQRHLLWNEATERGLLATDDEIRLEIQTNPPPFIRAQPIFQSDSAYDHSKYLEALDDPAFDFSFLETYIRATLPLQKLQEYMASGVRVTDEEARMLVGMLEDQVVISYLVVSPTTDIREGIPDPTESELSAFYAEHMEDFRTPEKRVLDYVEFPKEPSVEDEIYAREKIEEAYDLISTGEDFSEIAAEYTDDERTRKSGGDIGWMGRGSLTQELDSLAFSLPIGQMSEVIKAADAFYIIRVEDTREQDGREEARLSMIVSRLEASPLTIEQISLEASDLAADAERRGLETAAADAALDMERSGELVAEQLAAFFRVNQMDAETIGEMALGGVLGPIEGTDAFYTVETHDIMPSAVPALETIEDFVRQSYRFDRKKQKAKAITEQVLEELAAGSTLEQVASDRGLRLEKAQPFTRRSTVPGIGTENVVVATAFALDPNEVSGAIEHAGQFYIIRVDERQDMDEDRFTSNLQNLKMSLASTKQQVFISEWYQSLKSEVEIEDYRSFGAGY
jgi:peptidyl-prolyl cis-trans isomerase D